MRRRRKKSKIKIIVPVVAITVALIYGFFHFSNTLSKPVDITDKSKIEVEIPSGSSGSAIADILAKDNLIKNKEYFLVYAKSKNLMNFKSGVYEISKSQSLEEILTQINKGGRPAGEKITIKEGTNANQIATLLAEKGLVDKNEFIELTKDKSKFIDKFDFLKDDSITSLEGYLYPQTYFIPKGTAPKDIVTMFLEETQKEFKKNDVMSIPSHLKPYIKNINELIALASIVEKEAVNSNEKDVITGVFLNRLKMNMPLQSCPTIEYVTGEHKIRLSYADTQIKSPYNTYLYKGITPTPICTPTVETINAVKNPKDTPYVYFVAKTDGTHVFSKTYKEHLENTKKIYGEY